MANISESIRKKVERILKKEGCRRELRCNLLGFTDVPESTKPYVVDAVWTRGRCSGAHFGSLPIKPTLLICEHCILRSPKPGPTT